MDCLESYTEQAISLLRQLVSTPSFSKEENETADIIESFLESAQIPTSRIGNNVIAQQEMHSEHKPTLVLNSHHDTVRPSHGWTLDPFSLSITGEKLSGLGANDAGGCLVSLIITFIHYYKSNLPFRLVLIASAEEEISGKNGLRLALQESGILPTVAIVGEPTSTQMAIAEKGLLVIDGLAKGVSGHAAHHNGHNALYTAVEDIKVIQDLSFPKSSELLGPVKLTVTQINAGKQHNVIPDSCRYVIDCRVNEYYSNIQVLEKLRTVCKSELTPRSTHLASSSIPSTHPLVIQGLAMGKTYYGSPTLSDQVFFNCPSIKIGPGESTRSHQADEYIYRSEIKDGIETYIGLINNLVI